MRWRYLRVERMTTVGLEGRDAAHDVSSSRRQTQYSTNLEAEREQVQYWRFRRNVEFSDRRVETLSQSGEEIQRDDEESLVRFFVLSWIRLVDLKFDQRLMNDPYTSLEDRSSVGAESLSDGDHDGREALQK